MPEHRNRRDIEPGVLRDLHTELTYEGYLRLDLLLAAQQPLSVPEHHDEMLFIIQHQTSELWIKLVIHELRYAIVCMRGGSLGPALKALARVKAVQRQLFEQWEVLATLTPSEYIQFRDTLGHSSGFQSVQYRTVEFLLGNKNADMIDVFGYNPEAAAGLRATLQAPSLYDEFLGHLARHGHPVPDDLLQRDVTLPHEFSKELVPVLRDIYRDPDRNWAAYETCEALVDLEESFQLWRFRHMKTVERIIGYKRGTGGSSGVGFLKAALQLTFFPEILAVRTELGT
ncbi:MULTISPECIES: tryptophan 2,3-dioxygenase [Pseudonocardia]|uniref:Tryptophan 2,3-dioxygenase n=2 Tax=Pseudonocardia TaxID=1847 RepID=A0A1Y2MI60_PSEAH|nr:MULTISPECIES: tryptophan 2,3-dioxygenase family protein [Pseudonocardia]OSY34387.1 Tryptophan 2,3-dioxygenase [Pseudonocardia autotrophica]TDN76088.1 tryptophan 2,3-dioxygenase [Pseudonocardia autotrophica]BBG00066.1 tryptophan 2,3-dioxygenase [Pseudonocardia autotrophica]GEC29791.1 tryptophan 2,3-dioxygenase [Pseudonocardia saturnea]